MNNKVGWLYFYIMQKNYYKTYFKCEDNHWWFVARRRIIKKMMRKLSKDEIPFSILEVGAGTGGNLRMLSEFGPLSAIEMDAAACELANSRNICTVKQGALPNALPFDERFDIICMLDVLEHIQADYASLIQLKNYLKPNGKIVLTVPAYMWLWSAHDDVNQHVRRYTKQQLSDLVSKAGLNIRYMTYYNTLLFPLIVFIRFVNKWTNSRSKESDLIMPSRAMNACLRILFESERWLMPWVSYPFGVSVLAVVEPSN